MLFSAPVNVAATSRGATYLQSDHCQNVSHTAHVNEHAQHAHAWQHPDACCNQQLHAIIQHAVHLHMLCISICCASPYAATPPLDSQLTACQQHATHKAQLTVEEQRRYHQQACSQHEALTLWCRLAGALRLQQASVWWRRKPAEWPGQACCRAKLPEQMSIQRRTPA